VTLIVGFGSVPPSYVTAANYYTYLDFSKTPNFQSLKNLGLRTIVSAASFQCSATAVKFKTSEDNSLGGFMGQYAPIVDLVTANNIPPLATPPSTPDSCGLVPPELPAVCQGGTH
jgi:hypothetical protein